MKDKTTLIDIYEAAGGKVNEDRTQVEVNGAAKPFDIVLRVIPTAVNIDEVAGRSVTFAVLLDDTHHFEDNRHTWVEHEVDITLPIEQVRILKEES